MSTSENAVSTPGDTISVDWGEDAPRGGKTVMNRILKEKATVPLFFAQTLIQSLRDVGYNHTTSALCEHIDNAIQADARDVRVFFRQSGKRGEYKTDIAVYDNGHGMAPRVLKVATSFGGSLNYGNRSGIARFGMGMKTAALSVSPVMELYSWQESAALYSMILDTEAIGKERTNLVELPDPTLLTELPHDISSLFTHPMSYPSQHNEQDLFASDATDLYDRLGSSGTVVYMPACDRLTYAKARTLVDHAVKEMARVYRRQIAAGLKVYVNNRLVEAFDPTYSMASARHVRFIDGEPRQSKLIISKSANIPLQEHSTETAAITIKLYKLPIEDWSLLSRKVLKNDLRVFEGLTVSILRNDREVYAGSMPRITTRHSVTHWYRLQIDFPGVLDEAFGVSANKQGVRLKGYVEDAIKHAIGDDITTINEEIRRFQGIQAAARRTAKAKPSTSEIRAGEADPFQPHALETVASPEEEAQLEENLKGLAVALKREDETEDEAFERIKGSRYIISFKHDKYWPFYDVAHKFGRVILTINTEHPFFKELYEPVNKISNVQPDGDAEELRVVPSEHEHGPIVALELLLLSLARTQSRLVHASEEAYGLLDSLRREWSEAYRIQMTT